MNGLPSMRETALRLLMRVESDNAYPQVLLDNHFKRMRKTEERDRAFGRELVLGTIRYRRKMDYAIDQLSTTPTRKMDLPTRNALRLGAYQILQMDRIPDSAAVNETVEAVKAVHPRSSGVVNAVLRRLAREPGSVKWPDPESDRLEWLGAHYAHPESLVKLAVETWGSEEAERWLAFNNQNAPLCLRTNALKVSRDDLLSKLQEAGGEPEPAGFSPDGIYLRNFSSAKLDFQSGLFYAQDEAAQQIARLAGVRPGSQVLEVGAAPGGKTGHLAALMENQGRLVVVDRHAGRMKRMRSNLDALGVSIVSSFTRDFTGDLGFLDGKKFDAILLDVPCSGWGTLRRHPEKKWSEVERMESLGEIQYQLLVAALDHVGPGGRIVYSTCTVFPQENEQVVDRLLAERPGWGRIPVGDEGAPAVWADERGDLKTFLPIINGTHEKPYDCDGFYAAVLKRKGEDS